jgi:hypothetical protein
MAYAGVRVPGAHVTLTEEQKKELDEMAKRFAETKGGK